MKTYTSPHPFHVVLQYLLIALPIISLMLNAISWLQFGIDLPFGDDWRQYFEKPGRLDFSYLMQPANDTLYPVGLFLDSLAVRFLDGNTVAYQFLSLTGVLGALLLLQWRLLSLCIDNRLIKACAFSLTVFMLQPGTYWGLQNMAYHQAIPLVCVMATLHIMLSERWKPNWAISSTILLGLISGFTYISGAFAMLGLSFTVLLVQHSIVGEYKKRLLVTGLSLMVPALLSTAAQVWVIVGIQHGTHRPDAPMAYPWESDFWFYLLGKIGRSLNLPDNILGFYLTIGVVGLVIIACLVSGRKLIKHQLSNPQTTIFVVFSSLIVVITLYLMLVAAGRTNLRPSEIQSPLAIFAFGFLNYFHFFWITLLWPWLVAIFFVCLMPPKVIDRFAGHIVTIVAASLLLVSVKTNLFEHKDFYQSMMERRLAGVNCIRSQIQKSSGINCPMVLPDFDLSTVFAQAKKAGASFTRNITYFPLPFGTNDPHPLYRMSAHFDNVHLINAERLADLTSILKIKAGIDPMLLITTGKAEEMRNCLVLEINVRLTATQADYAQLFFLQPGKASFNEDDSRKAGIRDAHGDQDISFSITSETGFSDQLRFDPVTKPQELTISKLEIRCRALVTP